MDASQDLTTPGVVMSNQFVNTVGVDGPNVSVTGWIDDTQSSTDGRCCDQEGASGSFSQSCLALAMASDGSMFAFLHILITHCQRF